MTSCNVETFRTQMFETRNVKSMLTCTCGKRIYLRGAYKCIHCALWFCRACGKEHFNQLQAKDKSAIGDV